MHYYPHHIGDYYLDTGHLEPMEDLCYRRLLDLYYSTERPISTETQRVASRLRLGYEIVETVLKEFFELREDGWHQPRCDAEIAKYNALADKSRENGKQGGRPKKTQRVISGNPAGTQQDASGLATRTKNHEPRTSLLLDLLPPDCSEVRRNIFTEWLQYKTERKETYMPTGFRTLIKKFSNLSDEEFEKVVENSMASNYAGIFPDKTHPSQPEFTWVPDGITPRPRR
jgi:uncharacterized protein YdaU (DUF1376 family)